MRAFSLTIVFIMLFVLSSCGESDKHSINNSSTTTINTTKSSLAEELKVSDPATTNGTVSITFFDPTLYFNSKFKSFLTNLSFLGFKDKVVVSGYTIDDIGEHKNIVSFNVPKDYCTTNYLPSLAQASCLIMVVDAVSDHNTNKNDPYLVMFDYANHKSYKTKIGLFGTNDHYTNIELYDVTGDNIPEIIISNQGNKWTPFEIYRFENQGFKNIFTNTGCDDYGGYQITGKAIDGYQGVIECDKIEFKKTVSLLDIGLDKFDLDIHDNLTYDDGHYSSIHIYNNGKIKVDDDNFTRFSVLPFDDDNLLSLHDGIKKSDYITYGIKIPHDVTFGKYYKVCRVYAYLHYNPKSDYMEIYKASIEKEQ